jgi:hypothetical protein
MRLLKNQENRCPRTVLALVGLDGKQDWRIFRPQRSQLIPKKTSSIWLRKDMLERAYVIVARRSLNVQY